MNAQQLLDWLDGLEYGTLPDWATAVLVGFSLYVAWRQLGHYRRDAATARSLALIGKWHEPKMADHVRLAHRLIRLERDPSRIPVDEPAFFVPLLFLTEMAVSVKAGLVDEDILHDYFGGVVRVYYRRIRPWVRAYRELRATDEQFEAIDILRVKWTPPSKTWDEAEARYGRALRRCRRLRGVRSTEPRVP